MTKKFLLHKDKEEEGKASPQSKSVAALPCNRPSQPHTSFSSHGRHEHKTVKATTINGKQLIYKNMYNEQLEKLIEMALMDGELTEKEKQVLFKKAEAMGVDLDEFEMVLEAKLYEKTQAMNQETEAKAAPKSDKFGDVKKCPACGAMVQSFQSKCPDCGHDYSNIESNASIQKLFKMLDDVESGRKDDEGMDPLKAFGGAMAKGFGMGGVGDKINNRKKEIIKNFPIPTTKDDILEFLSLAIPNARKQGNFFTSGAFNSPANERNKLHNDFSAIGKLSVSKLS